MPVRPFASLSLALCAALVPAADGPSTVRLEQGTDGGWILVRNGEPFLVKGAGGKNHLDDLAAFGGNSIRTWGMGEDTSALLDAAHARGITVTLGFWMGHKRHGFDYGDPKRVQDQLARFERDVRTYRDHPAVLAWAIGNEMELEQNGNVAMWQAINACAVAGKAIDPHHPMMTVIADLGPNGQNLAMIKAHCPDLDLIGVNSYGGVMNLAEPYRAHDPGKPYLITEYARNGAGNTRWGAEREKTSTEKAAAYAEIYHEAILGQPGLCLGGYTFLWGSKSEVTETFFGCYLKSGERTAAAEVFADLFGGRPPANRSPHIEPLTVDATIVSAGAKIRANVAATDPDGDPLTWRWELRAELGRTMGGDHQDASQAFVDAVKAEGGTATITAPTPGSYRLYVTCFDGQGNAATANEPILVTKAMERAAAPKATLPHLVYGERATNAPWAASGAMGDHGSVQQDPACTEQPQEGATCLKVTYTKTGGWTGLVWQNPADDWGDQPGGLDLSGATELRFWARGAKGGEQIEFSYGIIGPDKPWSDTANAKQAVTLTTTWTEYRFDLTGKDLSRIKTPFCWVLGGTDEPITFYLDAIEYR